MTEPTQDQQIAEIDAQYAEAYQRHDAQAMLQLQAAKRRILAAQMTEEEE